MMWIFLSRLENMPENERQDWNELDDVSDYLVHRFGLRVLMTALIAKRNENLCTKRYGEKANELISLDVYEHSFRII